MRSERTSWVVYLMTIHNRQDRMSAVCEQHEWDAIEHARPGYHQLVQAGISSEVQAEAIARSQRMKDMGLISK